jgi:ribose transport system substrate-binding protein
LYNKSTAINKKFTRNNNQYQIFVSLANWEPTLTIFERRQRILEIFRFQPEIRIPELAAALGVSQGTVRNDLEALAQDGQLQRLHGGAVLTEAQPHTSPSFAARARRNEPSKLMIARWAAEKVEDSDAIFLDSSSTVYAMARYLKDRRKLRVFTNGFEVARSLADNPTNTVVVVGGLLDQDGSAITGPLSEQNLQGLHIQKAFFSCSGFSPEAGLSEVHMAEARLKTYAITSAEQVFALVDSSKFGKVDLTTFARLEQLTHLFTDEQISQAWVQQLQSTCLNFTVCAADTANTFSPCSKEAAHYRIGFANLNEHQPFAVDVRRGLERAAKGAGNVDLVLADNQLDPAVALQVAERFLQQNLDLVIEYQIDEQVGNRLMNRFQEAGLPVIAVDIPIVGATYFGVDHYRAGTMAGAAMGEWVANHWGGKYDRVIIMEEPRAGALPASRTAGQLDGLESRLGKISPDQQIRLNCANTVEISEAETRAALKRLPNFHRLVFLAFNDDAALGAMEAAVHLGREADVSIVGQGADRRVRSLMELPGSRIIGSTAFLPEQYGQHLVELALKILRGEPVPPAVYMSHSFINAAP